MALTDITRRSFLKLASVATATAAVGIAAESNLVETDKAYAEDAIVKRKTFCRSCPRACGVIAHSKNGRVIKLEGNPDDIYSKGAMCAKGLSAIQALYHPNRTKYPMKRIGERGVDNTWERITWDEAIDMIAKAMADMRDKYGRNGLLVTTGGGGNPRIIDSIAFRDYWGAGNIFEPGAAQCAMPRTFMQKQMDGWQGFVSIGDSQCQGCFNPQSPVDCFVQWGAQGCASSSTINARFWNELRDRGCTFINVDPRFNHDSARADVWLPIRPGTDVAMMMAWINHLIENEKYDAEFVAKWTNLPFLVDPEDEGGALLRASKVFEDVDARNEGYVYFDTATGNVTKAFAMGPDNEDAYHPQTWGEVEVALPDGRTITCKTGGQALKESVQDWTIEKACELCWVPLENAQKAVKLFAESKYGGIGNGVSQDQFIQSAESAMCVSILNQLKGNTCAPGVNAVAPHPKDVVYSMGKERGRFTYSMGYDGRGLFNPNEDGKGNPLGHEYITLPAVVERLGYIEHKGLGDWKHSHIPSVYDAIMSGEPYQPRVWYERSGNKMVTLADAASWVDAFKKMDFVSHCYMYPTSFTFEAADVMLPATEWLEMAYDPGAHGDLKGYIVPLTVLFEHCDDRLVYGTIFKQLADKYNDEMAYNIYYVDKQYYTIHEYEEYLEDIAVTDVKTGKKLTWEETMEVNGWRNTTEQEYWDEFSQYGQYLQVDDDGLYYGMGYKQKDYITWAGDIKDNPRKDQTYCDRILWIGRHGNDPAGELPPASQDYSPVPFYQEPLESPLDPDVKAKYPLVASNGRLPYYHHSTLRNIPYLRETYPVPEIWIDPQAAAERGIETGDWVNVKSQRCEEQEIVKDGIYARAFVTPGINPGCVYMERFWNPEFLEEGQDARKSWTTCNWNVLSRREGPHNPVMGTYTLRGVPVQVAKSDKPEGVWCKPEDFEPWMPQPSENTGGGY